MPRLFIDPDFGDNADPGDGGIRRVVTAQRDRLPLYGYTVVSTPAEADIALSHAGNLPKVPPSIPLVSQCHGLYWREYQWEQWCYAVNAQVAESLRRADAVISPSEWVSQSLRRSSLLSPITIPHGIDPAQWEPVKQRRRGREPATYVLYNKTRTDPVCDPRPLWEVAKRLPGVQFISTAPLPAGLAVLPNLTAVGRLPFAESRTLLRNASAYLCTSRETFGIGTLEAMAAAVPVVGYDWAGQHEIFPHGNGEEGGLLVPVGDVEALAAGVERALEERNSLGRAAREHALERYTWDAVMPRYVQLFDAVLGKFVDQQSAPAVSVIVTCYKLAHYLERCVKSVLAQTLTDLEVVIVNDASPDDTAVVAARLAAMDSRVTVVTNATNQYLAAARNTGVAQSRGRYILPLDADDLLTSNTLALLVPPLEQDRSIHVTYGGVGFFDEGTGSPDSPANSEWPAPFSFSGQVTHRNQLPYCSLYRRSVWERTGGYRARCKTAEDAEFWVRASSYGFRPRKVTDAHTLVYCNRSDSMSHTLPEPDWTAWFPWSRQPESVPFIAAGEPVRKWRSWPISHHAEPQVAVVIPVGPGHERYLIDALDSVDAQFFRNWECVVVNDTGQPLTQWLPPWAKIVERGEGYERRVSDTGVTDSDNGHYGVGCRSRSGGGAGGSNDTDLVGGPHSALGPARARNLGIAHSTAPLILPLDADDYLQPTAIGTLLAAYEPGVSPYSDWYQDKGDGSPPIPKAVSEWSADLLLRRAIAPVTALFSRSDWERVGGYPEDCPGWEDWAFSLSLAAIGVCGLRVPSPLLTYRMDTGTVREDALADKERNLAWIHEHYDREAILMACRSCGGRPARPAPGAQANPPAQGQGQAQMQMQSAASVQGVRLASSLPASDPGPDMVLLEYTGGHSTFSITGRSTSARYRFGNNEGHQKRYVHRSDVAFLLGLQVFRAVTEPAGAGAPLVTA